MHHLCKTLMLFALLTCALWFPNVASAQVKVQLYQTANDSGTDITYSTLLNTFTSSQIRFATDNGFYWFPFGGGAAFGADMTGFITVPVTGDYTFATDSDDGSYLFLNGSEIILNGGGHGPQTVSSATQHLVAGTPYPFEVKFQEEFGGDSGVDLLVTPPGGSQQLVPASYFKQSTGLELGVVDQRTWVGNTSEFTVNIKNVGITPQTLSSAVISGTPWTMLLSTLPVVPLQPGDQTQLTYRLTVPNNAVGGGSTSPIVSTVSLDVTGNSNIKYSEPFQINLYQNPVTQIVATVQDDVTFLPIANALVALDNSASLYQTDNNGRITINVAPGTRTVFAYAPGHLPGMQTVLIAQGAQATANLSLPQGQALAVSSVTATPLTLAQIKARGINLNDPSNFFIYDFVIKLTIGDTTAPSVIFPAHPAAGSTVSGSFSSAGGGGGIGGYYSFYFPTGDPTIYVATLIIIEGDIRVLKQFWDATVVIINNTSLPINSVNAALTVPTGLSLPPLNGNAQPLSKSIGNLAANTMAQAEWVVRGDVAGTYQLTGTATGTLALGGGNIPLSSTLNSNPITVVAPRLGVVFTTPDSVTAGVNFTLGIDITNNSVIDLQEVLVHIKPLRLVNCILASGQADTVNLGDIAVGVTKHVDFIFTSLVTGKVLEVQSYVSPDPEISPDVIVNAAKVKGVDDTASTFANTSVNVPVLSNDEGDTTLSVASVTNGAHGTVTTDGLQAFYQPNPGFVGKDYFSYTAQDTKSNTGTANVQVTVSSVTPGISGFSPDSSTAGSAGFDLIVNGSGFDTTTQASWNGSPRMVAFVSPTQIKVTLLTGDLAAAGLGALMLTNPSAGSVVSSYAVYNINQGSPVLSATIGSLSRDSSNNIVITVNITNTGQADALSVGFTAAAIRILSPAKLTGASSLGGVATIFIGTTQQYTLVFPASAGTASLSAVLQATFSSSATSAQGRSQRVTLP